MKNLKSTTYVVIEQSKRTKPKELANFEFSNLKLKEQLDHATFLKQTPTLGLFVPCDEDGNVLEKRDKCGLDFKQYLKTYDEAQSKVIFKGFEVKYFNLGGGEITNKSSFEIIKGDLQICVYKAIPNYFIWNKFKTIEDLVPYNLEMV